MVSVSASRCPMVEGSWWNKVVILISRFSCCSFMTKNPARRLGVAGGAAGIRQHAFFKEMDWAALTARRLRPPFRPKARSRKEAINFDAEFTKEEPTLTPVPMDVIRTINQEEFHGFSFINSDFNPSAPPAAPPAPAPAPAQPPAAH
ncbi:hypothetical protein O0L34_g13088 [Tuta absoluta]|nr:hypothetical protein O0L34_g13088 [Tuta absoluta]